MAMSSISGSGGGRRVGGPQGPIVPTPAADVQKKDGVDSNKQQQAPNDGFERGAQQAPKKAPDATGPQMQIKLDGEQKFNDMLRQTRNDPKALSQLANTLNLAYNRFASEFAADKGKASALLDQLSQAKFSASAVEQTRAEVGSLRERMAVTKHRMAIQKRRLRALKQLAGRVSESRLAEEIAAIEARMEMLETGWAESFVGLGLGKVIYTPENPDTPEHLKKVVKANVGNSKKNADSEDLGELISEIHPARVVAQVAAREIDQTKKKKLSDEVMQKVRKEKQGGGHGRTVQAFAALSELFDNDNDE
jgi:hypothetical protein